MTPQSIRDGFNSLRADKELLPLADAAKCRSEADWLVGINGTRAMTAFNSKEGGFYLTTVGRVQRSEEHTSELQSQSNLVCRLLLEKKKTKHSRSFTPITCILTDRSSTSNPMFP